MENIDKSGLSCFGQVLLLKMSGELYFRVPNVILFLVLKWMNVIISPMKGDKIGN